MVKCWFFGKNPPQTLLCCVESCSSWPSGLLSPADWPGFCSEQHTCWLGYLKHQKQQYYHHIVNVKDTLLGTPLPLTLRGFLCAQLFSMAMDNVHSSTELLVRCSLLRINWASSKESPGAQTTSVPDNWDAVHMKTDDPTSMLCHHTHTKRKSRKELLTLALIEGNKPRAEHFKYFMYKYLDKRRLQVLLWGTAGTDMCSKPHRQEYIMEIKNRTWRRLTSADMERQLGNKAILKLERLPLSG